MNSSSSKTTNFNIACDSANTFSYTYVDGFYWHHGNFYYVCEDGAWVREPYFPLNDTTKYSYDTLVDPRDNQRYLTIEVSGYDTTNTQNVITFTVMAQNLNYGTMVQGANEQDDDNTVEKYCYSDTAWYCEQFGGLYQWAEMMALPYECNTQSCADQIDPDGDGFHQGICPDGWHLITYNEMHALASNWNNSANGGYAGMKAMVLWSNAQGTNNSGFSAVGAGYRDQDGEFVYLFKYAYYYYPVEHASSPDKGSYLLQLYSSGATMHQAAYKTIGSSVRCVKNY